MCCALHCCYSLPSNFLLSSSISAIIYQCLHCSAKQRRPIFEKVCNISMEATSSRSAVRFSPSSKRTTSLALRGSTFAIAHLLWECAFALFRKRSKAASRIRLAFRWTPANLQVLGIIGCLCADLRSSNRSTSVIIVLCKPAQHFEAVFMRLPAGTGFDRRQLWMVVRQQLLRGVLALLVRRIRVLQDLAKERDGVFAADGHFFQPLRGQLVDLVSRSLLSPASFGSSVACHRSV